MNFPWGTEKKVCWRLLSSRWKWSAAQKPRGLKQGWEARPLSLSSWPARVCTHVCACSSAHTEHIWISMHAWCVKIYSVKHMSVGGCVRACAHNLLCAYSCVCKGVQVCARCLRCVLCVLICAPVCVCSAEGKLAECISVNDGGRCLFVLSPGWIDTRKFMDGCGWTHKSKKQGMEMNNILMSNASQNNLHSWEISPPRSPRYVKEWFGGERSASCISMQSFLNTGLKTLRAPCLPETLLPLSELVYNRCLITDWILIVLVNTGNTTKAVKKQQTVAICQNGFKQSQKTWYIYFKGF